jgi:D-serine deaminase-like pyridoxal phosphate-dependent protein
MAMLPWQSCAVGDSVDSIDTPALVLDLDAFERNLDQMMAAAGGMRVRPHAKSHKCPEVARQQILRGAVGICCQKLSEAAVFAQAGIQDILLTNQVVGPRKLERLRELSQQIKLGVLVDDAQQIQAIGEVMANQARSLDVYVEVEVGAGRCGASPQSVLPLVQQILAYPGLQFAGLHCYHGPAQHLRSTEQRSQAIDGVAKIVSQTQATLQAAGIAVPLVTGAGTGTFWHERDSGVYHEIQAGSFAFMDRDYATNVPGAGDVRFEHALFIKTTVLSATKPDVAIVDAGLKASSVDSGMPAVHSPKGLKYLKASDEHGVIELEAGHKLELGDTLWLIPGHCDPTMNLYDDLVCVRNGKVQAIWPIAARGASL